MDEPRPLPLQLIELADTWRERGDIACADDLEILVNLEENRAGLWISFESLERQAPHLIPEHVANYGKEPPPTA
jgi:hypothetical protein